MSLLADSVDMTQDQQIINIHKQPLKDVLHNEALALCASLRANSAIPHYIVPNLMTVANSMLNTLSQSIGNTISHYLLPLGEKGLEINKAVAEELHTLQNPLSQFCTEHKQESLMSNHELFVKPIPRCFSSRFETSHLVGCIGNNVVYNDYQYVPIIKTLRALFKRDDFVSALFSSSNSLDDETLINDFVNADRCKSSTFLRNKYTVKIQLYYDDMATTNPLRGATPYHNLSVFYYTIRNLPNFFNTCFPNVHLLALCHALDLKSNSFDPILETIVGEIRYLEKGVLMNLAGYGDCIIYRTISQVTCDNLALNSLFGFIASFTSDYFCTNCYTKKDDIQTDFRESATSLRSIQEYENDLQAAVLRRENVRGIKRHCILNKCEHFHVINNLTNDCMHTFLEGVIPTEISCILYNLVFEEKLFTIDYLNEQLNNTFSLLP